MKKMFKMFILTLAVMFMANVKVNALSSNDDVVNCLTGTASTCKMTDNVTLTTPVTITSDKILDLAGKTLTVDNTVVIDENVKLTINGNGKVYTEKTSADPMILVSVGSTLIADNATLESQAYWGATVKVLGETDVNSKTITKVEIGQNATVIGNYPMSLSNNAKSSSYGTVLELRGKLVGINNNNGYTDGSIGINFSGNSKAKDGIVPVINIYETASIDATDGPAIYGAGYAIWNIKGGSITGTEALSIKSGIFNITGGTFVGNGEYVTPEQVQANNNGSEATGAAISITGNDGYAAGVELNIKNADVNSINGYAIFEGITKGVTPAVKNMAIEDGNFEGKVGATYAENATGFILGGAYSSEIKDEYISKNLEKEEVNGTWYVGEKYAVSIAKVENGTVTTDISSAFAGQTVTITTKANDKYKLSKLTVTDKDGKEVEVKDGKFVMPESDVTVTATFKEDVAVPKTIDNVTLYFGLVLISAAFSIITFRKIKQRA